MKNKNYLNDIPEDELEDVINKGLQTYFLKPLFFHGNRPGAEVSSEIVESYPMPDWLRKILKKRKIRFGTNET